MKHFNLALIACATLFNASAFAGPARSVADPGVEYGEREIEFAYGTEKFPDGSRESAAVLGFGYGVTQSWFTEVAIEFERADGETKLEAFEWENKFQLTTPGQYAVDLGLLMELEIPNEGDTYEFAIGPMLQKDIDQTQLNFNLIFERQFHDGASHTTELVYQWQAKYRYQPVFEFGLQGFGELGTWNDWNPTQEQEHVMGPAVFGKFHTDGGRTMKYDAGYLLGVTDSSPDYNFRMTVEYEF